jgi:cell division protein FtsA
MKLLDNFIGERYFCGLDIGLQTTKAALLTMDESHRPAIVDVYEFPTAGVKDMSVSDIDDLAECIHRTITGLSGKTGVKIRQLQLGLGGHLVTIHNSSAVIPLMDRGSKVIADSDVRKLKAQARLLGIDLEQILLHDCPQYYNIDGGNLAQNPVGLYGRKLEVRTLLVTAQNALVKNLIKAIDQAGYEVANTCLGTFMAGQVCLTDAQRQQGCFLANIGARRIELMVFKDQQLRYVQSIPMGGGDMTACIARKFNLAFDLAEEIKKSYACAMTGSESQSQEEILIRQETGYLPIQKKVISQAIEPAIIKTVDTLKEAVMASGFFEQVREGMVIIGGGGHLPGLPERIEQATGLSVQFGHVQRMLKGGSLSLSYAVAIGLAQEGFYRLKGRRPSVNGHHHWARRLVNRVKELYQEYF